MLSRVALLAAALLPSVVPSASAAVPASAPAVPSTEPGWTAQPAAGGRPYVYLEGLPGAVLEDRLSVTNPGAEPLTVRLRPAGSRWIALASDRVTVPPRTRADVPFAVTVPTTAPPGDHPARIVATAGGRAAVVRVHARVAGPTLAALTVEDVRVAGGRVHYALVNRGNTTLAPRLSVHAAGLTGTLLSRPARALPLRLEPGRRVDLTEPWSADPPALDSVDITLRVTAPGGAHAEATASARYVPWGLAGGAGGAVALGGAALMYVRRRRVKAGAQP
ncbi:hypothetical protein [Streptomyces sp. NPDC000410]|uniref:COG1470 family protein n=1 Tax=Streptomyces sp. NPDC000410 TaxID=3154254 RepID=UPI00331A49AC